MQRMNAQKISLAAALLTALYASSVGCASDSRAPQERTAETVEEAHDPGPVAIDTGPPDPMMTALGEAFRETNPGIASVTLLEYRRVGHGGGANFVVARGIRPRGRPLDDELFGVFVFDDSLKRIRQTLDVFPTRRWLDYTVAITHATGESVWVAGRAISDSLDAFLVGYRWKP
jgi:hypothetical protein